jgi:hypothetical protein
MFVHQDGGRNTRGTITPWLLQHPVRAPTDTLRQFRQPRNATLSPLEFPVGSA